MRTKSRKNQPINPQNTFTVVALNQRTQLQCTGHNVFISQPVDMLEQMDDIAIFNSAAYAAIFGQCKKAATTRDKLSSIVRIKNSDTGRIIRRQYRYIGITDLKNDCVALSPASIRLLCNEDNSELVGNNHVEVSKGNLWDSLMYYWEHPFHATRISIRLGLPALILSILGIIISLFGGSLAELYRDAVDWAEQLLSALF